MIGVALFGSLIAGGLIGGLHTALGVCVGLALDAAGLGIGILREA